jgi:DNA-binding MarR family transcriptional regulator
MAGMPKSPATPDAASPVLAAAAPVATPGSAPAAGRREATRRDHALDEIEGAFGLMARKAGLPRVHERMCAAAGIDLDLPSFNLLRRLGECGPARASDLAALACLDLSTVSRQVASLEHVGLVERRPDPLDGRASLLLLSSSGKRVSDRLSKARRTMFAEVLAEWPEEDVERFGELLYRFARAMARMNEPAPGRSASPREHRSMTTTEEPS